ncbi:TetR/AcrR family transcriptional regulator [Bibersteinia trehalosi]|uniref:TetR/AcrR family transcriptional regulator n=1 Tax=Bibersteinia trehalosi TaxID=47735 RepID=UPI00404560C6
MKKEDPRITRTRKVIHDTFLALLEEKNYDEITVQDILDKAGINRSTFYKHYLNKDALASHIIERLKADVIIPILEQRFSSPTMEFALKVAPIINEYRKTIRLLWQIETRRINLKQDMQKIIRQKYLENQAASSPLSEEDARFQGQFFAIISIGMLEYVLMNDKPLDPQKTQTNLQEVLRYFILK